jgi:hypothetical protein
VIEDTAGGAIVIAARGERKLTRVTAGGVCCSVSAVGHVTMKSPSALAVLPDGGLCVRDVEYTLMICPGRALRLVWLYVCVICCRDVLVPRDNVPAPSSSA